MNGLKIAGAMVVGLLAAGLVIHSRLTGDLPTNHLQLQLRCGDGDERACDKVDRMDREGCEKGNGHSCNLLGIGYANRNQPEKAAELHARACALGDAAGCWYAGNAAIAHDQDGALALYQKSCDGKHDNGCLSLGDLYARAQKRDLALQAYDKGCALGYRSACDRAAELRR